MGTKRTRWLAGVLGVGVVVGLAVFAVDRARSHSEALSDAVGDAAAGTSDDGDPAPGMVEIVGPWGRLREIPFWLAIDETQMSRMAWARFSTCPAQYPDWGFPGWTRDRLEAFLRLPAFAGTIGGRLASLARCGITGCAITPTADLARELGPEARAEIYNVQLVNDVAPWPGLTIVRDPANLRSWLDESEMAASLQEEILRRTYKLGGSVAFSDVPLLCPLQKDEAANQRMLRAWFFTRALMVKLRVMPGDDLAAIEKYWQPGLRRDLTPLLQAAARRKDGLSIDVSYLLPRPVRGIINSFPLESDAPLNCYWTAMQFHVDDWIGPVSDEEAEAAWPGPDFREIPAEEMGLGDVLAWRRVSGRLLHVAVHIAADVFLTKNGAISAKPWVLTTRKDLDRVYGFRANPPRAYRFVPR